MTRSLHPKILEIQALSLKWKIFKRILLEEYNLDDLTKVTKKDFMDWLESHGKAMSASDTLHLNKDLGRFWHSKKPISTQARRDLKILVENEGLTSNWVFIKRPCGCYDKNPEPTFCATTLVEKRVHKKRIGEQIKRNFSPMWE